MIEEYDEIADICAWCSNNSSYIWTRWI